MSQINESAIATPGVYINEIDSFPPSVAQVATAIPVFIGYTQTAVDSSGNDLTNQTVQISSLVEYTTYYGLGPDLVATVNLNPDNSVGSVVMSSSVCYQMYNAVQMFFNQGGGVCYILSVGSYVYSAPAGGSCMATYTDFMPLSGLSCFDIVQRNDVITLITIPDAVMLSQADFDNLMTGALTLCGKMQDRFTIMDVYNGSVDLSVSPPVITSFRTGIGNNNLNYGAAYYPWILSSVDYNVPYKNVTFMQGGSQIDLSSIVTNNAFLPQLDTAIDNLTSSPPVSSITATNTATFANGANGTPTNTPATASMVINQTYPGTITLTVQSLQIGSYNVLVTDSIEDIANHLYAAVNAGTASTGYSATAAIVPPSGPNYTITVTAPTALGATANGYILTATFTNINIVVSNLEAQLISSSSVYAAINNAMDAAGIVVPVGGAVAGVYAAVDGTRGVWKAPANVSLNLAISPSVNVTDDEQGGLNIDTTGGKSINAIRSFTGQGTLVWGARTLAGNDNNWKYIPVRRFFIMVEESVKQAAFQFVFEPNVATTWMRLKTMIANYLTSLWRLGAITGSKPEQGFYVSVGLGQTMTQDDILNGRLIVEVGIAPVRPAEFIILRFTQTQQQS